MQNKTHSVTRRAAELYTLKKACLYYLFIGAYCLRTICLAQKMSKGRMVWQKILLGQIVWQKILLGQENYVDNSARDYALESDSV